MSLDIEEFCTKELRTQVEIAAPAERVWQMLADFAAFPRMNHALKVRAERVGK